MKIVFVLYRVVVISIFLLSVQACNEKESIVVPAEEEVIDADTPKINWVNWYLSVPLDSGKGKATSIFYQDIELDRLNAEQSEFFHKSEDETCYIMYTRYTGYTTSGEYPLASGTYCRTELREFWQGNQNTSDNWYMDSGTHLLESTLQVDYCEGRGRTYVAQIHGKSSGIAGITNVPATVKVMWDNGNLNIEYYIKPVGDEWTSNSINKLNIGKVDNEKFTIKLRVTNGVLAYGLSCPAKGIETNYTGLYDYASNGYHYDNYFKTGNYFIHNTDYTQSAQVRLYKVLTDHY